jgi:hypothetical protein
MKTFKNFIAEIADDDRASDSPIWDLLRQKRKDLGLDDPGVPGAVGPEIPVYRPRKGAPSTPSNRGYGDAVVPGAGGLTSKPLAPVGTAPAIKGGGGSGVTRGSMRKVRPWEYK